MTTWDSTTTNGKDRGELLATAAQPVVHSCRGAPASHSCSPAPFPLAAPRDWSEWVLNPLPQELHQLFFVAWSAWEELRSNLPVLLVRGDPGALGGPV